MLTLVYDLWKMQVQPMRASPFESQIHVHWFQSELLIQSLPWLMRYTPLAHVVQEVAAGKPVSTSRLRELDMKKY